MDNLNHLYNFFVIAQVRGLTKATSKLHLTQAALSYSLKTLETTFKTKLVDRTSRSFHLTEDGEALMKACQLMFSTYDQVKEEIVSGTKEIKGRLTLGTHVAFGVGWLPMRYKKLRDEFPNLKIDLNLSSTDILKDLSNLKSDIAIVSEELMHATDPNLVFKPAFTSEVILVGTPQYLKTFKKIRTTKDLAPLIVVDWAQPYSFLNFVQSADAAEIKFKEEILVNNTFAMKNIVMEGLGVTFIHKYLVQSELRSGRLQQILPKSLRGSIKMYFAFTKQKETSPKVLAVMEFLEKELSSLKKP